MLTFKAPAPDGRPLEVLCLGAHADDIEIGAGGTVLRILADVPDARFHWVVFSASGARGEEARTSAEAFLAGARNPRIVLKDFRDGFFPYVGYDVKEAFEALATEVEPDIVLTHCRGDLHQDHRLINELTWNTFRDHLILEYEIFKYDADLGQPNLFVYLDEATCQKKADLIWTHFASQRKKPWFTKENMYSLLRLRGVESRAPSGLAEAFHCRKVVL
jgi:LmbE family N-acetylglucosaminyl deacetylase